MSVTDNGRALRDNVVCDAIDFAVDNFNALMRLGLVPMLGAFLLSHLAALVYSGLVINQILYGVAGVIFAVGIHRMIIGDENPNWILFRFRRQELAYTGLVLLCILLAGFGMYLKQSFTSLFGSTTDTLIYGIRFKAPLTPALVVLGGSSAALAIWVFLKLVLVFPHAAITGEISLGQSWNATTGNFWRLLKSLLDFPFPTRRRVLVVVGPIAVGVTIVGYKLPGQLDFLFDAFAVWPVIATAAAASSFAYKDLIALPVGGAGVLVPARSLTASYLRPDCAD